MHRTQICLQDELHDNLKAGARSVGVNLSELIRRTLERDIQKDPVSDARAVFDHLTPIDSFAETSAETYVDELRSRSRLLRTADPLWRRAIGAGR